LLDFFDGYNRQLEAFLDRSLDWWKLRFS
jgi:hypothetical protein